MWQDRLKKIIDLLEASNVNEIEVSFWGRRFRVSKGNPSGGNKNANPVPVTIPSESEAHVEAPVREETEDVKGVEIRAPMVGTFYRGPSPESPPFVEVGSHVTVGQTLCIIEAMKIMNEIESDVTGRVAEIPVENAQPVDYGHLLFTIEPD